MMVQESDRVVICAVCDSTQRIAQTQIVMTGQGAKETMRLLADIATGLRLVIAAYIIYAGV
jgi:ATP:corrinoid adenosyltransferase